MNENFNINPDFLKSLPLKFFKTAPSELAQNLLGKLLVKKIDDRYTAGMIVETEAYLSENDLSSHSAPGLTKRNAPMFEEGGILYVYKIYGVHHCINIVSGMKGQGCAVLLRALQPALGVELLTENRNGAGLETLCKGPGNLAKAFGFTVTDNFSSLCSESLFLQDYYSPLTDEIVTATRIGIKKSAELPLRFYLKNNKFVSGKKVKE